MASCYTSCLEAAVQAECRSIAFCCISTGEYRYPRHEAALIAIETVSEWLKHDTNIDKVVFDVFTAEDRKVYQEILGQME